MMMFEEITAIKSKYVVKGVLNGFFHECRNG